MKRKNNGKLLLGIPEEKKDIAFGAGKGFFLSVLIAWLFYQDIRGMLWAPACFFFLCKKEKKEGMERRKEKLGRQFAEFLGFLEEALAAGYSLERAVFEAGKGMKASYGEDYFGELLSAMQRKMSVGGTVEEAFTEFAERSGCEEAKDFAEVLYIAKRTGGAVRQVVTNTEGILSRKQETIRQIRGTLHSRLYENSLMKCMPFAMLLYLQIGMPGFLSGLYHNLLGNVLMTVLLLCYMGICIAMDTISRVTV